MTDGPKIDHIIPRSGQLPIPPMRAFSYKWKLTTLSPGARQDGLARVFCLSEKDARALLEFWDSQGKDTTYEYVSEVR